MLLCEWKILRQKFIGVIIMTKAQLKILEDLKFEIEKLKLEIELDNLKCVIKSKESIKSQFSIQDSFAPKSNEVEVNPLPQEKHFDLSTPAGRMEHYQDELSKAQSELKESTQKIADLQYKKRKTRSKSDRETLQSMIDTGIKENLDIQAKVKFIKTAIKQAREAMESEIGF